jgi:hypothetical protein
LVSMIQSFFLLTYAFRERESVFPGLKFSVETFNANFSHLVNSATADV